MVRKLVLLASYFIVTPVFIIVLIIYQLFLIHQNSQVSAKSLSLQSNIGYKAIPETINNTRTALSAKEGRIEVLKEFFARYKSPLLDYAKHIVDTADKYGIDYRLLPAIAMQESTLCKKIPQDSYNCWGFGIYGKKVTRFSGYEDAIDKVSKTLARDYHAQGLKDPIEIMSKYTPSNSGAWAENVSYIMDRLSASL